MRRLRRDLRQSRLAAYSAGTVRNLRTQWKAYLLFCHYFGFTFLPASAHNICLYAQFLSRSITPNSIRNYINGVRLLHLYHGFDFALLQDFTVRTTLSGISRLASHTPSRALAITVHILSAVQEVINPTNSSELVVFCTALFAFFLFVRLSNLLPSTVSSFARQCDFRRRHIFSKAGLLLVCFC